MFDIGLSELLLIAVVGLIVIDPEDLPAVMRHVVRISRDLRGAYGGIRRHMAQLADEAGIDELKQNLTTTIIDLDGNQQKAYDISDIVQLSRPEEPSTPRAEQ